MSEEQKKGSPSAAGGPAGKSLALMQQRLLSKPQAQAGAAPVAPAAQVPAAPAPAAPSTARPGESAAQQLMAAPQANQPAPAPIAPVQNRPKGKDFAAMAAATKPAVPAPAPAPAAGGGRPKGKDFAVMANRMGAASPTVAPAQPMATALASATAAAQAQAEAQDPGRAARMQAAARAAAGLPPLDKPTATSVTMHPPPIEPTYKPPPVQQTAAAIAAEARQKHLMQMKETKSKQPGRTQVRRNSGSSKVQPAASAPAPRPAASRPTAAAASRPPAAARPAAPRAAAPRPAAPRAAAPRPAAPRPAAPRPAAPRPAAPRAAPKPAARAAPAPARHAPSPSPPKKTPPPNATDARLSYGLFGSGAPHVSPLIGQRLKDLVHSLDPNYALDAEAGEQVLQLADDFLDKVTRQSLKLAQHRGSKTLDVQDVQLALSKGWGIAVPGLGPARPSKPGSRVAASGERKRRASDSRSSRSKKQNTGGPGTASTGVPPASTS